jgi:hypothetical protein
MMRGHNFVIGGNGQGAKNPYESTTQSKYVDFSGVKDARAHMANDKKEDLRKHHFDFGG